MLSQMIILLCIFVIFLNIKIGISGSTNDISPTIKNFEFDDHNDHFDVIHLESDPTIRIYFSKSSSHPAENKLYYYSTTSNKFDVIDITVGNQTIIIDEIDAVSNKFFCVSYRNLISLYLTDQYKPINIQKIEKKFEYHPHPTNHNFIAKYSDADNETFSVVFSSDFGEKYDLYPLEHVMKFDWIKDSENIIFISNFTLKITSIGETNKTYLEVPRCVYFIIFEKKILIVQHQNNHELFLDLHVYDIDREELNILEFPKLYRITDLEYAEYEFDSFYLSITDQDNDTCLWKTRPNSFKSIRQICQDISSNHQHHEYFYINKRLQGVLFFNVHFKGSSLGTMQTHNDGRFWSFLKLSNSGTGKFSYKDAISLNFSLSDSRNIPSSFEFMDIHYINENSGKRAYATLDNGITWSPLPSSSFAGIILNFGSPIISIAEKSDTILYSVDELKSWKNVKALKQGDTVIFADRLAKNDVTLCVVSRSSANHKLKFTVVDFSNIYSSTCQEDDFYDWTLPRFHGSCYLGQIIVYRRKKAERLCLDTQAHHKKKTFSSCPCLPDDYGCAFNFHTSYGFCLLDKHSGIVESPRVCREGSHYAFYQSGYVRIEKDKCIVRENDSQDTDNSDLCIENDWTNFLAIFKDDGTYVSQIRSDGSPFRQQYLISTHLSSFVSAKDPISLDLAHNLLYKYANKSIQSVLRGDLERNMFVFTWLYYTKNDISRMQYAFTSNLIIFLTNDGILRGISLLTNFEYILDEGVTSFKYSVVERFLYYVKSRSTICFSPLFEKPICRKMAFDMKDAYGDFNISRIFIHKSNNDLKVYQIDDKNLDTMTLLYDLNSIDEFYEYNDNLYLLANNSILYQKVTSKDLQINLFREMNIKRFIYHPASISAYLHLCEQKGCQFMCAITSEDDSKCICPQSATLNSTNCICPANDPDCLKPFCHGFYCKNKKCMLNNVRCNGIDDCGDNSDENGCKEICKNDFHLCEVECLPKNLACKIYTTYSTEIIFKRRSKWRFYVLAPLIIFAICLFGYIGYRIIYFLLSCLNNRRMYSLQGITKPLIMSGEPVEFEHLLDHESDLSI